MQFNRAKFKAMVHYVCRKMATDSKSLGATKLHKVLWFSDGYNYTRRGVPMSGEKYIKHDYGPFSTHLAEVVHELEGEHKLRTGESQHYGKTKKDFIGVGVVDTSSLTERELRILDENIDSICYGHTANSISEKSHDEIWEMAYQFEQIPYEALIAKFIKPTDEDIEWAKSEIARISQG
ncbi:MAG: SocA family protein [Candidatus Thiodiazotropha sp. (ex Codakia orbicularis)]|nr:SocA family protein [Candidatus Thiodiazotropha sp. (ex Codakia orbicularis)]